MDIRLDGKVAIVTGAGGGIGRGIARGLAESGAAVAVLDIRNDTARSAAEEIGRATGARTLAVRVDVTKEDEVERAVAEVVKELGGLDILVNNAGIARPAPLVEFELANWEKTLAVNLTGYFLMARAAAKVMIGQGRGGSIVNISSKSGVRGSAEHSAYTATKFGEVGLAQGWARELAACNIRVNAVLPGNVLYDSGIWNKEYKRGLAQKLGIDVSEVEEHYVKQVPLGRACRLEDIANLVVFLVSEKAGYITGCLHLVDGGQEMR